MKSHLIGAVIALVIILSSCQNGEESDQANRVISIEPENSIDLDLEETLRQAKFVTIETTKESVLYYPDKVITSFGNIYILDRRQKALLLFDSNGQFKNKLKTIAKPGPLEIADIKDISINPYDSTISAMGAFYIAKLSPELKVLEVVPQKVGMWHHYWISENEFLYYSNFLNPLNSKIIGQFNFKTQEEGQGLLMIDGNPGIRFIQPWIFHESNYKLLICPPLSDTVYQYFKGSLITHLTFDYGNYQLSKRIRSQLSNKSFRELKEQKLIYHIINYRENKHNIMFGYHYLNKHKVFIYFAENEIGYTINGTYIGHEKLFLRRVGNSGSGELISWFSPEEVKKLVEAGVVPQDFAEITPGTNPVLCFIEKIFLDEKD